MKKKILTRKLIIASIIWLIILIAGIGAYLWFEDELIFFENETRTKNSEFQTMIVTQEDIAKNITESVKANEEYIKYSQSAANQKNEYRKNALISTLSDISKELKTVNISVIMKPFEPYKTIPSIEGVDVSYSNVEMKFSALSDVAALQLLQSIQKKLEGKVYVKKFDIEKIKDIDSSVLLDISNGGTPDLVTGNVNFDWIRIEVEPSEEDLKTEFDTPIVPNSAEPAQAPPIAPKISAGGQDV